jgi:RluA family pseudouridine synthase
MRIEADIDTRKLFGDATSRDKPFELSAGFVLFEDSDLLAVEKPPGLPSQPTLDAARDNLFAAVSRFLQRRDGIATPYVGVHQRLDRDTSGVVLFTKSKRVNAAVAEIFSKHYGTKRYQALTGRPKTRGFEQNWTVRNHIGKIASRSKRSIYGAVSDGEYAETSFHVLAEYPRGMWLEVTPKTGRTHQIRVHLSEMGLPITGDDLYGPPRGAGSAPRLMLHATELVFPHPITGRETSVKSPLPQDFAACLRRLRASD